MILGIDIGGTKTALALADEAGHVLARRQRATEPCGDAERDVARIARDARTLIAEAGCSMDALQATGVSVPGPLDIHEGVVMHPPNLPGWKDEPLREWLTAELRCPVRLENDANAAALAEWRHGAGRGRSDIVYLTMSTGVGAGLILSGALYRGRDGTAGELGHVPVEWGGAPCTCGLSGCLEAYVGGASWTAWLRRDAPESSRPVQLAGGRNALRPEHLVAAAREGDAYACAQMDRYNDYLARAIVQLTFSLAPEAVILGTIPTAAGEALCFEPVRERVHAQVWPHQAPYMQILPSALGEELPYRAGLCVAMDSLARS